MNESTNINEYIEEIRKEISNIESVRICELYGGELDVDDIENINLDLRVNGKCHTFVDLSAVKFEKDLVNKKIFANLEIQIYVIGQFDRKTQGHSLDCSNCIEDIIHLINEKSSNILRVQPGLVNLGAAGQLANAIRKNQRFSIWYLNFNQKIRIK